MDKLGPILNKCKKHLEDAGVLSPSTEARAIVGLIMGMAPEILIENPGTDVDQSTLQRIENVIQQRINRTPIERIFGTTTFCDIKLHVLDNVFKPYPETQYFVEHVLDATGNEDKAVRILDLGTGTGCIILSLLHALPNATGIGVDIDESAIKTAKENAAINSLQGRVEFRLGNWAESIEEKFDIVVCNPPRVSTGDIPYLLPEMRNHDPYVALDGGPDGLKYYYWLERDFARLAKPNGYGIFQIGEKCAGRVYRLFSQKKFQPVEIRFNYQGQPSAIIVVNKIKKSSWNPK